MDILDQIRLDHQRFPHDQSYHLYDDDVYFEDLFSVSGNNNMIGVSLGAIAQPFHLWER